MDRRTVIIGVGNTLLGDDGVGIHVARLLRRHLRNRRDVSIVELFGSGLPLMESMVGFQRAVVVDAIITAGGEAGSVSILTLDDIRRTKHSCSTHDGDVADALDAARFLGMTVPAHDDVRFVGVEAADTDSFSDALTVTVRRSVARAADTVIRLLADERSGVLV